MLDIVKGLLQPAVLSVLTVGGFVIISYLAVTGQINPMEYVNRVWDLVLFGTGAKVVAAVSNGGTPKPPGP